MTDRRTNTSRRRTRRRVGAAVMVITCGAASWSGCSVEKHYETLSFFFDGVPDPNAPGAEGGRLVASGTPGVALAVVSQHSAFEERRCSECHGETGEFAFRVSGFSDLTSEVCMKCHSDVMDEYEVIHGPVAAQECLWCHQPHESPYEDLLSYSAPKLCLDCHSLGLMGSPQIPEHMDLERSCLDCHFGHGGETRAMLRPPPAEPVPTETSNAAAAAPGEERER
jgi:predicted CXXCH cytochrome family protein